MFRLFQRRTIWWPTWRGWIGLLAFALGGMFFWVRFGEDFLATTQSVAADTLVVEGWIGSEAVKAAAIEFGRGGYIRVVVTGGLTGNGWSEQRWSYVDASTRELVRWGVPADRIIPAAADDVDTQRTYENARAVQRALIAKHIQPRGMDVFTRGTHGRRSRCVYAKVFSGTAKVGIISFKPWQSTGGPWWRSSARTDELVKETLAYCFELFLGSGRFFLSK